MPIAIISDIQGNAFALEQVLAHIQKQGCEQIFCLGDLVTGPEPLAVLDLLQTYNVSSVRGNMDEFILAPVPYTDTDSDEQRYSEIDSWVHQQLTPEHRAYLATLELCQSFQLGHLTGLCFHAAPQNTETVIDASTATEQLDAIFQEYSQDLLLTGHMHQPMLRTFNEQILLNPGSVGLPYGAKRPMPNRAEYLLLSVSEKNLKIEFQHIRYDATTFKERLLQSGMPHAEWYLSKWRLED